MARVSVDYRANCLSPPTKAAVEIINLIVDGSIRVVIITHCSAAPLAVVADAVDAAPN